MKELLLREKETLSAQQECTLFQWLKDRQSGKPLQYIIGVWPFAGHSFMMRPPVLIPRNDSESVLQAALDACASHKGCSQVLDLCCGSGCLGLAFALETGAHLTAVDITPAACELTRDNAAALRVDCEIWQADILQAQLWQTAPWQAHFEHILCNPPYIPSKDIASLDITVRGYESLLALDGGEDGLLFYAQLARQARRLLQAGGVLTLEIGWNQAAAVQELFLAQGWQLLALRKDVNGQDRVLQFL